MSWISDNLGVFSIVISLVIVIAGFVGYQQYSKALSENSKALSDIQEQRIAALKEAIEACRAEAAQFKRWKGTLRYALGRLGFNIIDNDDFITLIEKGNKKTHTVRMKSTVDEQIEHLDEDEGET
jgi:hypothetical protein